MPRKPPRYLEFAVASNFSFLRGASHPEELMLQAAAIGLDGIGVCDRNSVAGVVRAHLIKREQKLTLRYHPGARLVFADGTPDILAYPRDRAAWGRLTRLLTRGNLRAEKGDCILALDDLLEHSDGLELIVMERTTRDHPPEPRKKPTQNPLAEEETNDGILTTDEDISAPAVVAPLAFPARSLSSPPPCGEGSGVGVERAANVVPFAIPPSLTLARKRSPGGEEPEQEAREEAATRRRDSALRPKLRLVSSSAKTKSSIPSFLARLTAAAPGRVRLAASMLHRGQDRRRLAQRQALAREANIPLIAVNDVVFHHPDRRELHDVVTCIREHLTLDNAGRKLAANAERYLKPPQEMARLFRHAPEAIEETLKLDAALTFSLDELAYQYPDESVPGFATPMEALEHLVWEGARLRYPDGIDEAVRKSIANEFALIAQRNYAPYFLTVYDIVRYARSEGILCQGRGSAANSTVCYCMGITSVDPVRGGLLFERFLSTERHEPPDIDVDFEHERREEVIQYIYGKYGRARAGIAATVISYRGRSSIREVGKVFGLSEDTIGVLSTSIWGMGGGAPRTSELTRAGIDVNSPRMQKMRALVQEIQSFPRHLSQHVGGFVMTRDRLDEVMPVMNGAMGDRTHVEWDKDDLDALNILKVDVLGLGMLTCIRKAFEMVEARYGKSFRLPLPSSGLKEGEVHGFDLATVPPNDEAIYDMLCRADSIGVFQVESRAQMSMLPRLRPRTFYDLVIEVAIVRPGPIQGDMVHPYLRRRMDLEKVDYVKPELEAVLKKTLGVPLFQEQAMKIAIVAGGFTPGEADKLRRAMATFKRTGTIGNFRDKLVEGMVKKGYPRDFAERCFRQIEGFGEYGFPESHAASFALLVYASAWLKCHYPDAFAAALLNSQPMGFYAPAQIVRDAREHGVEVRPVDINHSDWDATLEPGPRAAERLHATHREMIDDVLTDHAMRLGFHKIKGLSEDDGNAIVDARSRPGRNAAHALDSPPPCGEGSGVGVEVEAKIESPSWPGLSRPSTPFSAETNEDVDARHKAGHDENKWFHPYTSVRDLWLRTGLPQRVIERLADADAFGSLGLTRRQALWDAKALGRVGDAQDDLPLFGTASSNSAVMPREGGASSTLESLDQEQKHSAFTGSSAFADDDSREDWAEPSVTLPRMPLGEEVVNDYRYLALSLRTHPVAFLRDELARRRIIPNATLREQTSGQRVRVAGLITIRQRPGSASGVVFMTIEDESAIANIIVWPTLFERFRPIIMGARLVGVEGPVQHESGVIHVVAQRMVDLTHLLGRLAEGGDDVESLSRADAVKRPHDETIDSRARGRRNPPQLAAPIALPDIASDLDVTAPGSAHAPLRRGPRPR